MNSKLKKDAQNTGDKGFTIIEMVSYIALIGIILTVLFNMILLSFKTNSTILSWSKVNSDTHSSLERMTYEIINAQYVYLPTSNFSTSPGGQLSLVTKNELAVNEQKAYLDFYMENDTLFLKKDGLEPVALTSADVVVSDLEFSYHQNGERESITIDLTIKSARVGASEVEIHILNTIALR
ncbi:MAG: hypothetical protein KAI67_02915 [Candidatus Pacebacteria bacterium]|nr:hypothetical protein [Candidatus Paceibacterota bacterium]